MLLFTVFLLSLSFRLGTTGTFSVSTISGGSVIAKLIREGRYQQFLVEHHQKRAEILDSGAEGLVDFYDEYYLGNITLGTPAQTLTVALDTGSSNFWVIDAIHCTSRACSGSPKSPYPVKTKFNTSESSTFSTENRTFSLTYGLGTTSGHLGRDSLVLGGFTIPNQEFGLAQTMSDWFAYQPADGVLGLAWPALAIDKVVPPMQNLLSQLDEPLFTVFMEKKNHTMSQNGGLITFGALDTVNCAQKVDWVPLTSETYWEFELSAFSVGLYMSNSGKFKAISSTGTSFIGAPYYVINEIVFANGAVYDWVNELYTVDCSKMVTGSSMVFNIGGIGYIVKAEEYILDLGLPYGRCALGVFSLVSSGFGPNFILGDPFIRQLCNVYDVGNKRIGFADSLFAP